MITFVLVIVILSSNGAAPTMTTIPGYKNKENCDLAAAGTPPFMEVNKGISDQGPYVTYPVKTWCLVHESNR